MFETCYSYAIIQRGKFQEHARRIDSYVCVYIIVIRLLQAM